MGLGCGFCLLEGCLPPLLFCLGVRFFLALVVVALCPGFLSRVVCSTVVLREERGIKAIAAVVVPGLVAGERRL